MKQINLYLLFMGTIALTAICSISFKSLSYSENDYGYLLLQNVEALTYNELNPNEMYGYEMTPCYGEKKLGDRVFIDQVGDICEPTNPSKICNRRMQWGNCY